MVSLGDDQKFHDFNTIIIISSISFRIYTQADSIHIPIRSRYNPTEAKLYKWIVIINPSTGVECQSTSSLS